MQHIKIDPEKPEQHIIELTAETILNHGLVVVPTETVYGLVCSAFDSEAVNRIYELKGRTFSKPLPVFFNGIPQITDNLGEIPNSAKILFEKCSPGPLTVVLSCGKRLPVCITANTDTVGIRIPRSKFLISLIDKIGQPLASTSANRSNQPSYTDPNNIVTELGESVDLILDAGIYGSGLPSTVIDLTGETPQVLREGEITENQLLEMLKNS